MSGARHAALAALIALVGTVLAETANAQQLLPLPAVDVAGDVGASLKLQLPPELPPGMYSIRRSGEYGGLYEEVALEELRGGDEVPATGLTRGEMYWFRLYQLQPPVVVVSQPFAIPPVVMFVDRPPLLVAETPENLPGIPTREAFDSKRFWLLLIGLVICGSVVLFIFLARSGRQLYIRPIAGLEAIEEAVGRATEMGRSCLFIPGILDINDIQTIAGLTILSRVAEQCAEYDAKLEVPTSKSLVMTAARETVSAAFLAAGRPDAYNEDLVSYITDEQFGYVAYLTGSMVREEPAACFYLGAFFAESLILAETGNAIGAIQVAGTAQPAQLPFFVAACDYTLIGEEFFAASAYLSNDPDQLGSLKGQDVGKIIVGGLMIVGVSLLTIATVTGSAWAAEAAAFVKDTVLASG